MQTLSYGYKNPDDGDRGSLFFPALNFDIQRLNDHTHNGVDSANIPATSVSVVQDSILAASWAAVAGQPGTYRQLVTVPAGVNYDGFSLDFRVATAGPDLGRKLELCIERVSAFTYYVYINDNSLDLDVLYLV